MNKILLTLVFMFFFSLAFASAIPETNISYFYSTTCSHCVNVANSGILENVSKLENVSLEKYEVSVSERNNKLFLDYADKLGIKNVGTPFLVIEQGGKASYLIGDTPIIEELENSINNFNGVDFGNGNGFFDKLTLGVVVISALIDSINPCAFGVLLFLMAVLLSIGSSKRAFRAGLIYTFVIFLVYFLAGIGIMKLIGIFSILSYIKLIVGIVVLIGGLIELKDFVWEGKGISLKIPARVKPLLEKYTHKGTLSAIIILGALVALVELPCTGGIYLAILSLISSESSATGYYYLIIYNIIFVLPLVLITFMIYRGMRVDSISAWVENNKKYMRLTAGVIMILLALNLLGVF